MATGLERVSSVAVFIGNDIAVDLNAPEGGSSYQPRGKIACAAAADSVLFPIFFQAFGFGLGDGGDSAMLLLGEVGTTGGTVAEMAEWAEGLEVGGLHESEVVGIDAEDVVHEEPFVLPDELVHRGGFAGSVLGVNLLRLVLVSAVDMVGDGHLDAAGVLLGAVGHAVASVGHGDDVGVENLDFLVGIGEEQLRLGGEAGEGVVGVGVEQLRLALAGGSDGEIYHQLACLGVVDGLWSPCAADVAKVLREGLVDAEDGVRPMDEVARLHEHQSAVVAPSVFLPVTLPLGVAEACTSAIDVEVGGGHVEGAVRGAIDVRVANAVLLGDGVAAHHGLVVVHGCPVVSVVAERHVEAVGGVFVIDHDVGAHLRRLARCFLFVLRLSRERQA